MPSGVYKHKKGWRHSVKTKRKIGLANSISLKGSKQSPETIAKRIKSQLGKSLTLKHRLAISNSLKGKPHYNQRRENNPRWKSDGVTYVHLHKWVTYNKGRSKKCEHCRTTTAKKFEWANVDHKYRRVLSDYIRLCTSCHRKYDLKFNNKKNVKSPLYHF